MVRPKVNHIPTKSRTRFFNEIIYDDSRCERSFKIIYFKRCHVLKSLLIEYRLCGIQACLTTHVACACMFNRLRHNRLASTLGQVIWLDLAFAWGQGLSMQCRILSCHLDPHRHGPYVLTSSRVSGCHQLSQLAWSCHREQARVSLISLGVTEYPSIWVLSRHWLSHAHTVLFTDTVG